MLYLQLQLSDQGRESCDYTTTTKVVISAATTCRIKGSTKTSTLAEYGTKNITVQDQCSNYNLNSLIKAENHGTIQQQQWPMFVLDPTILVRLD